MNSTLRGLVFAFSSLYFGTMETHAQDLNINRISTYSTAIFDEGAAEISGFEATTNRIYFTNADANTIDVLDATNPSIPAFLFSINMSSYGGGVNSVVVLDGAIAVAVEADIKQDNGSIVFFDLDGNFINEVTAGALPDMVTATSDKMTLVVANEGEPNDDYTIDPEGSITVIDISAGIASATATQIDFSFFNDKKQNLINRGVRIYGPGASVAQDLEPEYVAIAKNDTRAYVALQENNAYAIVDLTTNTLIDILPLGYKNHNSGRATSNNIVLNEAIEMPSLGTPHTPGADPVKLGGFSGLYFDEAASTPSSYVFYTIPDRGPNAATVKKAVVTPGVSQNLRPFKLPNYQARIVKLTVNPNTNAVTLEPSIFLTAPDGTTPISGRGNIPGFDEIPVALSAPGTAYQSQDYQDDMGNDYEALPYDRFGGDFEGILKDNDGNFWMCDEYRPAIYKFNPSGQLISRFVPEGTSLLGDTPQAVGYYGDETLPAVYSKRRANRGFEAIAYNPATNVIYAFIQTPMYNPSSSTKDNSDVIRILAIDGATGIPVEEYVYLLENNANRAFDIGRVDKIGDAVYTGNGKFMVLERDSSVPGDDEGKKYIFEINLTGATNVLGTSLLLEELSADDLLANGIQAVVKTKVLNLPSIGYQASDKPEGLALLPGGNLAVLNDNDFGLAGAGITDNSILGLISFADDFGMDASNKDDAINITNWPTLGMYNPDAIDTYEANGKTFVVTANEGDSRDYDGYSEEERVKDLVLDPVAYPNAATLQEDENLGRLKTTTATGDYDGDGDIDQIYSYGARSFSIWDEYGNLVWDSADELENILATEIPANFNSTNDENDSFDNRSDDKGPEPEAIEIGTLFGQTFAFVGLERVGGIVVYNITNPKAPEFVQYINARDFSGDLEANGTDSGVEGLVFVSAKDSPNGQPLLISSNEVSGTISIFEIESMICENDPVVVDLGDNQTVHKGYTPSKCANLSTTVSGGSEDYTYDWNRGDETESINVCPKKDKIFSVKVTDARGCTAEDSVKVCSFKAIAKKGSTRTKDKLYVCHTVNYYGNTYTYQRILRRDKAKQLIKYGEVWGNYYLQFGHDYSFSYKIGKCDEQGPCEFDAPMARRMLAPTIDEVSNNILAVFPNPFKGIANINFSTEETENVTVSVFDMMGKEVQILHTGSVQGETMNNIIFDATNMPSGIYIVRMITASGKSNTKKINLID